MPKGGSGTPAGETKGTTSEPKSVPGERLKVRSTPAKPPGGVGNGPRGASKNDPPKKKAGTRREIAVAAPESIDEAPTGGIEIKAGMSDVNRRAAEDEADCTAEVKRTAKSSKNAHLAYNEDGYYIAKAACFAVAQFKKMGGA